MIYKVLTYGQVLVDASRLRSGIYETDLPQLYSVDMTLENLGKKHAAVLVTFKEDITVVQSMLTNMSRCRLIEVELTIK